MMIAKGNARAVSARITLKYVLYKPSILNSTNSGITNKTAGSICVIIKKNIKTVFPRKEKRDSAYAAGTANINVKIIVDEAMMKEFLKYSAPAMYNSGLSVGNPRADL